MLESCRTDGLDSAELQLPLLDVVQECIVALALVCPCGAPTGGGIIVPMIGLA